MKAGEKGGKRKTKKRGKKRGGCLPILLMELSVTGLWDDGTNFTMSHQNTDGRDQGGKRRGRGGGKKKRKKRKKDQKRISDRLYWFPDNRPDLPSRGAKGEREGEKEGKRGRRGKEGKRYACWMKRIPA